MVAGEKLLDAFYINYAEHCDESSIDELRSTLISLFVDIRHGGSRRQ